MPRIRLRPSFSKDLDALKRHHRTNYRKACEILVDLERDADVSASLRSETRVPGCVKYELADGYRLVFQKVQGSKALVALTVGKHDHVDSFLDGHKGHVFDPNTGRIRELRIATVEDTSVDVVPSTTQIDAADRDALVAEAPPPPAPPGPAFAQFTVGELLRLGVPETFTERLLAAEDAQSMQCMLLLEELEDQAPRAAQLLLAFITGDEATKRAVVGVSQGDLEHLEQLTAENLPILDNNPEEFITFDDPDELEDVLERSTLKAWQLFLHPAQKDLVLRTFHGPARVRGISGSGKTVIALHRARRLAKELHGTSMKVLFTTFNRALANSASRLLDELCGRERQAIEVTHLHRWCLDYLRFRDVPALRYTPADKREAQQNAFRSLRGRSSQILAEVPASFTWSEIEFLMGRFLHENASEYLTTDRTGRGRALNLAQREAILELYNCYMQALVQSGAVDPADFVRIAYRYLTKGEPAEASYGAVIVDEVQDLSELSLRVLYSLVGDKPDGLLLVGDNTQRIFTRGFSMKQVGIDISGRGVVLRKNYRNTRQILDAAFPLVAGDWEADAQQAGLDANELQPEFSTREGSRPIVVRCRSVDEELAFIIREIRFLLHYDQYEPSDICVMARTPYYRDNIYQALQSAGLRPVMIRREEETDGKSWDGVVVCSLHQAKGHEFAAVIIVGAVVGALPPAGHDDADHMAEERAVLYVGMTRARDILYVSYAQVGNGKTHERSRLLDQVLPACDLFAFRRRPSRFATGAQ